MMDSVIAANSGAAVATASVGPRRLIIAEPPDIRAWPEASILGRAVADSLRRTLRPRAKQYVVVDQDSVRTLLAQSRDVSAVAKTLNADLLVSIRLTAVRDSAQMMLQVYDLTAINPFRQRAATGRIVPKNEVLTNLDAVLLSAVTYLDEMTRAPRRTTP
jgi:TolB-like protein